MMDSGDYTTSVNYMKSILKDGNEVIGNSLYERVRNSYISLRRKEITERAYYLWLQRGCLLWDAENDWYTAIEHDINSPMSHEEG